MKKPRSKKKNKKKKGRNNPDMKPLPQPVKRVEQEIRPAEPVAGEETACHGLGALAASGDVSRWLEAFRAWRPPKETGSVER